MILEMEMETRAREILKWRELEGKKENEVSGRNYRISLKDGRVLETKGIFRRSEESRNSKLMATLGGSGDSLSHPHLQRTIRGVR